MRHMCFESRPMQTMVKSARYILPKVNTYLKTLNKAVALINKYVFPNLKKSESPGDPSIFHSIKPLHLTLTSSCTGILLNYEDFPKKSFSPTQTHAAFSGSVSLQTRGNFQTFMGTKLLNIRQTIRRQV